MSEAESLPHRLWKRTKDKQEKKKKQIKGNIKH